MGKQRTEHLVQLIHSLTKAEKRHFKVYAKRVGGKDDLKFLQLFNALDKQDEYNEEQLLKKVPSLKREQLSNLKAHLYKAVADQFTAKSQATITSIFRCANVSTMLGYFTTKACTTKVCGC